MNKLESIGLYGISHHAIHTENGYAPPAECGADWACMRVEAESYWGDAHLVKNNIAFMLQVPYGTNPDFIEQWERSEAAKRGLFMGVQCDDEPELHNVSPDQIAAHIAAIKQRTSRPVWLNTFISLRAYFQQAEKSNAARGLMTPAHFFQARQAALQLRAALYGEARTAAQLDPAKWDALDYLKCGQDVTTFDHYSAMGTTNCSWFSTRDTFRAQVDAFNAAAPAGMTLGAICQAFNFNRCGVPDVNLEFMNWHLDQMRAGFGDREFVYVHYAHEFLPNEGIFPPQLPALRKTMREFRAAALPTTPPDPHVGAGFTPSSVTVAVGDKVGVTIHIPSGTTLTKIETPPCVEGWPVDTINQARWGTVNGVAPGSGNIVFTLNDGTVTSLPVTVTERVPVPVPKPDPLNETFTGELVTTTGRRLMLKGTLAEIV